MNIWYLLQMVRSMLSGRTGLVIGSDRESFDDLTLRSRWWAERFIRIGLDDRPVAYVGTNQKVAVHVLFGSAFSGRAFLPLNYRLSPVALGELISIANPAAVVTEDVYAQALTKELDGVPVIVPDEATESMIGAGHLQTATPLDGDIAIKLFTSGTTSRPKLVQLDHAALSEYLLNTASPGSAPETEASLLATPMYHIAAVANVLSSIIRGRRLVLMPQFDAAEWLSIVEQGQVTHAMIVPTMLSRILDRIDERKVEPPRSLKVLSYGGSPTPPSLIERALRTFGSHVDFINAFGMTETSSTVAILSGADHRAAVASDATEEEKRRLRSIGRPIPGVELRVVGDNGSAVAVGEKGELRIRTRQLAKSYEGRPLDLDEQGWLKTGDAAWRDADGYFFVEGRMDDMIIRGGENISPQEIEHVLLRHPAVADAVVFGIPDPEWGQRVGALVVPVDGGISVDGLRVDLRGSLPGFKIPQTWRLVDEIPRNDLGKPLRRVAAELARDHGAD